MRSNRERGAGLDLEAESGHRHLRRAKISGPSLDDARGSWEPIVCPDCGADHEDTSTVRLRRVGPQIEARCSSCNGTAARFLDSVWSS